MNLFFPPLVTDSAKGFLILVTLIVVGFGIAMVYDLQKLWRQKHKVKRRQRRAMAKHLKDFRDSDDPPTRRGGF